MGWPRNNRRNLKIHGERNENENTIVQNLWDTAKAVLRWTFTAMQAYLKKQEQSQVNNLTQPNLKELGKEQQSLKSAEERK